MNACIGIIPSLSFALSTNAMAGNASFAASYSEATGMRSSITSFHFPKAARLCSKTCERYAGRATRRERQNGTRKRERTGDAPLNLNLIYETSSKIHPMGHSAVEQAHVLEIAKHRRAQNAPATIPMNETTNLIASVIIALSTNWIATLIPAPAGKQVCVGIIESNTVARVIFEGKTNELSVKKEYGIVRAFQTNDTPYLIIEPSKTYSTNFIIPNFNYYWTTNTPVQLQVP